MTDVSAARLPPFFGAGPSPAAAAAAAAAASAASASAAANGTVKLKSASASSGAPPAVSGTMKIKAGAPRPPRTLSDMSLVELGALATQLVVQDAIEEARKGTVTILKPPAASVNAGAGGNGKGTAKKAAVGAGAGAPGGTVARGGRFGFGGAKK
jgi:hypothetical protein